MCLWRSPHPASGKLKLGIADVPQQCWGRVVSSQSAHLLCFSIAEIWLRFQAPKSYSLALSTRLVGFFLWLRAPSCMRKKQSMKEISKKLIQRRTSAEEKRRGFRRFYLFDTLTSAWTRQAVCKTVLNVTPGAVQGLIVCKELEAARVSSSSGGQGCSYPCN